MSGMGMKTNYVRIFYCIINITAINWSFIVRGYSPEYRLCFLGLLLLLLMFIDF